MKLSLLSILSLISISLSKKTHQSFLQTRENPSVKEEFRKGERAYSQFRQYNVDHARIMSEHMGGGDINSEYADVK